MGHVLPPESDQSHRHQLQCDGQQFRRRGPFRHARVSIRSVRVVRQRARKLPTPGRFHSMGRVRPLAFFRVLRGASFVRSALDRINNTINMTVEVV